MFFLFLFVAILQHSVTDLMFVNYINEKDYYHKIYSLSLWLNKSQYGTIVQILFK